MAETGLIILLAGLLPFGIRVSFIAAFGRWQPPPLLTRALRYVPPAVLSAIILPEMLMKDGQVSVLNPRLFAGALAIAVAWKTKNTFLTIVVGMVGLYVVMWVGG